MKRFKRILAVVDPSQNATSLLERAVSLAQNNQAVLTAACVAPQVTAGIGMPDGGPISADLQEAAISSSLQYVEGVIASYRSRIAIDTKVLVGTPFLEIIREVLRNGHDLVIKSPEEPVWLERLFGSDDMHLLRKCPCPVWLVKHSPAKTYRRIVAAVDVDMDHPGPEREIRHKLNVKILQLAVSLALSDFAELHVVHAWEAAFENAIRGAYLHRPDAEVSAYLEQVRQQHEQGLDALISEVIDAQGSDDAVNFLNPSKYVIKGPARKEIPALAKDIAADLIVMGTVARTGVAGLFIGNTAEAILEQVDCPVLAVKPEGFQTPVTLG